MKTLQSKEILAKIMNDKQRQTKRGRTKSDDATTSATSTNGTNGIIDLDSESTFSDSEHEKKSASKGVHTAPIVPPAKKPKSSAKQTTPAPAAAKAKAAPKKKVTAVSPPKRSKFPPS